MGDGGLQAKMFNGKYEPILEFPEGWGGGVQTKKPSVGGVLIFSGTTHYLQPHYEKVAWCTTFPTKMSFICM